MRLDRKTVLLWASVASCAAVVAAVFVLSVVYTQRTADSLRREQIAGCVRANQQREYINALIKQTGVQLVPIVVPVCADIIK